MKICILGCGLRTPLLLSGLLTTGRVPDEVALYDIDIKQAMLMAALGHAVAPDSPCLLRVAKSPEEAIEGCDFVICSIRPGGMAARARDERVALEMGYTGQETVGPAGCAMAWRTIPAVLDYVRLMEKLAPQAWLVNFTNPAGLVTQAVRESSAIRAVGICDTPAELFFRISLAFGVGLGDVHCHYYGLNHLGFIDRVEVGGEDRLPELLADNERLNSLYPAPLFPPVLIRQMGLLPTEYVYFYLRPKTARANQLRVGRTRGEELVSMNHEFATEVATATAVEGAVAGLRVYTNYLNRRNASYMQLEGAGTSAFTGETPHWDPFAAVTGYHRIAVETIQALWGETPASIILNVTNEGSLPALAADDVVEIACQVGLPGITRPAPQRISPAVYGLLEATKSFERSFVRAALEFQDERLAWALTQHPLIHDWDAASALAAYILTA